MTGLILRLLVLSTTRKVSLQPRTIQPNRLMYFGVDYHPEHWVYPYDGTKENPEARWDLDIELMQKLGVNVVRMGEFVWGICEQNEGEYDFAWLSRVMDKMHAAGIRVVLGTPTAAPPPWMARKHPEILPVTEEGLRLHQGTRHAACLNCEVFWDYSKKIVTEMAKALGQHPSLVAWQIDNGIGGHTTEFSFNEETRQDWHAWLEAKYESIENFNDCIGNRFWGQVVTAWDQIPMPMKSPTVHNPALVLDWMRFSSDTIVYYVKMQVDLLHELTPNKPVTSNLRALSRHFDHFDVAECLDFVALDSYATLPSQPCDNAMDLDMMRCLKKEDIRIPGGKDGFWVIEQKAGNVNWLDINSLLRPGIVRLFTYQVISKGADGVLYFFWRQPRIGSEKFYGGVLNHVGRGDNRVYREIQRIGQEMKLLDPIIKDSKVVSEVCILINHENAWTQKLPMQPTKLFNQREHIMMFYRALYEHKIQVDFARPGDDLSKYKIVIAPSLNILAGGECDRLKLYVHNGGILVGTFNTSLVNEHNMAPLNGIPGELTDLFGLEVEEFDVLPIEEENHLVFKGSFHVTHMHPGRIWFDLINPEECEVLATYSRDFYAGRPAVTLNKFGNGKAIYLGTMSHSYFYHDLIAWLRQMTGIFSVLKVPDSVEVSMRQKDDTIIYFLLNHHHSPVRLQFYKPVHDYLTGATFSGKYDLQAHEVLVLDEHPSESEQGE